MPTFITDPVHTDDALRNLLTGRKNIFINNNNSDIIVIITIIIVTSIN